MLFNVNRIFLSLDDVHYKSINFLKYLEWHKIVNLRTLKSHWFIACQSFNLANHKTSWKLGWLKTAGSSVWSIFIHNVTFNQAMFRFYWSFLWLPGIVYSRTVEKQSCDTPIDVRWENAEVTRVMWPIVPNTVLKPIPFNVSQKHFAMHSWWMTACLCI